MPGTLVSVHEATVDPKPTRNWIALALALALALLTALAGCSPAHPDLATAAAELAAGDHRVTLSVSGDHFGSRVEHTYECTPGPVVECVVVHADGPALVAVLLPGPAADIDSGQTPPAVFAPPTTASRFALLAAAAVVDTAPSMHAQATGPSYVVHLPSDAAAAVRRSMGVPEASLRSDQYSEFVVSSTANGAIVTTTVRGPRSQLVYQASTGATAPCTGPSCGLSTQMLLDHVIAAIAERVTAAAAYTYAGIPDAATLEAVIDEVRATEPGLLRVELPDAGTAAATGCATFTVGSDAASHIDLRNRATRTATAAQGPCR